MENIKGKNLSIHTTEQVSLIPSEYRSLPDEFPSQKVYSLLRMASDIKKQKDRKQNSLFKSTLIRYNSEKLVSMATNRKTEESDYGNCSENLEENKHMEIKKNKPCKSLKACHRRNNHSYQKSLTRYDSNSSKLSQMTKEQEEQMVNRLSNNRNDLYRYWELIKSQKERKAIEQIEKIRNERHPKRKIDRARHLALSSPKTTPMKQSDQFSFKPRINKGIYIGRIEALKSLIEIDDSITRRKVKSKSFIKLQREQSNSRLN